MTQLQLDTAVADVTGESLDLVRSLGFSLASLEPDDLEPEDLVLAVICPFCRDTVPYPGSARDGALPLAECDACDVYFEIAVEEVIAAGPPRFDAPNTCSREDSWELRGRS